MHKYKNRLLAILLGFLVAAPLIWADPDPVGRLSGRVVSPDGSGIPGVRISIFESGTWMTDIVSGLEGRYRISDLRPGDYELRAELQGFDPSRVSEIRLSAGQGKVADIKLSISKIKEFVTVVGTAPRGDLHATEARESSARDLGEALARVNGVWKIRKGGIANDIILRGFASKDVNVLIDGERTYGACPNHMDPTLFHVDFAEVDRVETAKGPFDIKNQGSLGGVLNVITRTPEQGFHGTANFSGGSFGFINPSATLSYAEGAFSAAGGLSFRRSQPYVDAAGRHFTDYANYLGGAGTSDAFRVGTGWGKFTISPLSNHVLQIAYTRQEADHVLYPYLQMDAVYDDTDRLNVGYQIIPRSGLFRSLRAQGYFTQVKHWMTDAFRVSSIGTAKGYSMGTMASTLAVGGKLEAELASLSLGFEAYRRGWKATTQMAGMAYATQYSIPDVFTTSFGAYADYHRDLSSVLRLATGVRLDYVRTLANDSQANTDLYFAYNSTRGTSAVDVFPSGHVQLAYALYRGLELQVGVGSTVRVPDARERYFGLKRSGSDWVGNPDLAPSRNTGIDASLVFRNDLVTLTSSLYFNSVKDFVTVLNQKKVNPIMGIMNSQARSYENINAEIYGGEFMAAFTLNRKLSFSTGLSLVRGTTALALDRGITSTDLPEMPPFTSRTLLRFDDGLFWGELEGVAASAQRNVDIALREEPTAGYGVGNMRFGVMVKGLRFWVALNNFLDNHYVEYLSYQRDPFRAGTRVFEPGRNFFANLEYRF